jgi:hypothetical protein
MKSVSIGALGSDVDPAHGNGDDLRARSLDGGGVLGEVLVLARCRRSGARRKVRPSHGPGVVRLTRPIARRRRNGRFPARRHRPGPRRPASSAGRWRHCARPRPWLGSSSRLRTRSAIEPAGSAARFAVDGEVERGCHAFAQIAISTSGASSGDAPRPAGDAGNGQNTPPHCRMARHQRHAHQTRSRRPHLQRAGIAVADHANDQRDRADHDRQSQPDRGGLPGRAALRRPAPNPPPAASPRCNAARTARTAARRPGQAGCESENMALRIAAHVCDGVTSASKQGRP